MSLEHSLISKDEFEFLLFDWLKVQGLFESEYFGHLDKTAVDAALQSARSIATEYFLPFANEADEQEPHVVDGKGVLPAHMKPAMDAMREGGWFAAARPFKDDGAQLPYSVIQSAYGLIYGANLGTAGYALLTMAAANLLAEWGSDELKSAYLPQMLDGRYLGTMCLSEPDSGSSLANIKTRAVEVEPGNFAISGTKMWITGGEHELSENIVHLVLAKLPDAPAGVKGISLFLVPRYRPDGNANNIKLVGLNHKMGYRGTINTVIEFGDEGESLGYLVGEKHNGLQAMFHMMNEARIGVGYSAAVLAYAGYKVSHQYANERVQGTHPGTTDPTEIPIIEHADVRRMLWIQRANADGALALTLYASHLCDLIRVEGEAERAKELETLLGFLTPLCKAWASEAGLEANYWAIQVLGGAGYTRDFPVERYYRDNRLNPIHEGTNTIQAMDLLGRKTLRDQGATFRVASKWLGSLWAKATEEHASLVAKLQEAWNSVGAEAQRAGTIAMTGDLRAALGAATPYMEAVGSVVAGSLLLDQALSGGPERAAVAGYFIEVMLPVQLQKLKDAEVASGYWLKAAPHAT